MAVDERRRSGLFEAVARVLGEDHAVTMFEMLPPPGSDLATQQGMSLRFDEVDQRFEQVDRRFEQVDRRFEEMVRRFEEVDRRFDALEARVQEHHEALVAILRSELGALDARILQARDEAIATSRAELVEAVAGQTRTLVVALIITIVGVGTLSLAFAQLL